MKGLQQRPSWHGVRARVHDTRLWLCVLPLLAGCGPSSATTGEASGTESGETGEPGDEILWTYGGADRPVLSWPVTDEDGNIFVLVGDEAVAATDDLGQPAFEVEQLLLASIAADGTERWTATLTEAETVSREALVRPVVGPGGNTWVHHGSELSRVSSDGALVWRSSDIPLMAGTLTPAATSMQLALDQTGLCIVMTLRELGGGMFQQEATGIGPDGDLLWRAGVGEAGWGGADLQPFPTETEAALVSAGGDVLVGCDTCEAGQVGLARLDPLTGEPAVIFGVPGSLASYRKLRWDGDAAWVVLSGADANQDDGAWRTSMDGETERPADSPTLFAASGGVWIDRDEVTATGFVLRWGDQSVEVAVPQDILPTDGYFPSAVAVVEPDAILVAYDTDLYAVDGESVTMRGLLLADPSGTVTWHRENMFGALEAIPAIGDGFIAYIEDEGQRLVAVKAPVTGVADGPWPIIGGNPQGTRSAE